MREDLFDWETERTYRLRDGRDLGFRIGGDPTAAEPIVYFHGLGASAAAMPDVKAFTVEGSCLIGINRPGYGRSSLRTGYTPAMAADDAAELLDVLGIERVRCVGYSAGGVYAQAFAVRYPRRVDALALVSSAVPLGDREARATLPASWRTIRAMNRYLPALSRRFFRLQSRRLSLAPGKVMDQAISRLPAADRAAASRPGMRQALLLGAWDAYQDGGRAVYEDAAALCRPSGIGRGCASGMEHGRVVVWHGGQDTVWPIASSEAYLMRRYPRAERRLVREGGHLLYLHQWSAIVNTL